MTKYIAFATDGSTLTVLADNRVQAEQAAECLFGDDLHHVETYGKIYLPPFTAFLITVLFGVSIWWCLAHLVLWGK